jgi:hypothetical protein
LTDGRNQQKLALCRRDGAGQSVFGDSLRFDGCSLGPVTLCGLLQLSLFLPDEGLDGGKFSSIICGERLERLSIGGRHPGIVNATINCR